MSKNLFDIAMIEMPTMLPVLPFTGSFLFPGMKLPLRIFETRYIRLIFNALATSRVVGMVQPVEPAGFDRNPKLYSVGCAGRISSFAESDDNLLLVTLTGICRFRVTHECFDYTSFRSVSIDFSPFSYDFNPPKCKIDRAKLFASLDWYAYSNKIDLNSDILKNARDEILLETLATMLPFQPAEKQALLECETREKFLKTMLMLLEMNSKPKSS